MNTKEKWIQETENSLEGLQQVEANPYLFSKILNRLESVQSNERPAKLVWLALSSLFFLAFLNLFILKGTGSPAKNQNQDLQLLSDQFELVTPNPINYY